MFKLESVHFKDILNIESLTINEKNITCIVGESGAGKSTLLKLLNKMISPDEGTIYYYGKPLEAINSVKHRQSVVYLSQTPYIYEHTIKDNLLKAAFFHQISLNDNDMEKALKNVHLNKALDTDASTLSGGEKQRLALARVMLLKTDVYLMDEPSSALDDDTEKQVIETIVNFVKEKHLSLIMITHSKEIAKRYADDMIVISHGKVKRSESIGE